MQQYFQSPLDFQQAHTQEGVERVPSGDGLGAFPIVPYTTNWNLLLNSRLLKAAHAVNTPSIWPNQCAAVDHRLVIECVTAAYRCCIQVIWEKLLEVFKPILTTWKH